MNHMARRSGRTLGLSIFALAISLCVGFEQSRTASAADAAPAAAPASQPTAIRINAGAPKSITDTAGNVWEADKGFADGDTVEREADLKIPNAADPSIYRSEHFGMTAFS